MRTEPKLCVCGRPPVFHIELHSEGTHAPSPRGRFECMTGNHEIKGPWVKGYIGMSVNDPELLKQGVLSWNTFAAWTSFGDPDDVDALTQVLLTEAREHGADSPVDYGDAEQLAKRAIAHLLPAISCKPVAYLKEWYVPADPVLRRRVDLNSNHELWLDSYDPVILPLGIISTPGTPRPEAIPPAKGVSDPTAGIPKYDVKVSLE